MPTIKDVAKLAQVSLGTVSNVLNGKTKNEELINRVESAMRELHYRPDASARSLKNTRTYSVGLVIPDIVQRQYTEFVMEMEQQLHGYGYHLVLMFSRNNKLLEEKAVTSFLEKKVDGIVIYSTHRHRMHEEWSKSETPILLISRNRSFDFAGDRIVVDHDQAFRQMLTGFVQNNYTNVGMVVEKDVMNEGCFGPIYKEFYQDTSKIRIVDGSKEMGFQAMFELAEGDKPVDAVFAGGYEIGKGIRKALNMLCLKNVKLYVLKGSSWIEDRENYDGEISVSQKQLVDMTLLRLIEAIDTPQIHESLTLELEAEFHREPNVPYDIQQSSKELHFAMYDCSTARSLRLLSMLYEQESGQKIHFDMYSYDDLEKELYNRGTRKDSYYDGFMIDITWFKGLVENGSVKNLDHILRNNKDYLNGFIDGAVKNYGMYVESLYSIPFMPGAQILFYQRDLFESKTLQMKFQRKYNGPLVPPQTWSQFNAVAEFFTKSLTPESPVKYGISMATGKNVYTSIDYLMRLWSYGGRIFDDSGQISINSSSAVNALKNMKQSYLYCSNQPIHSWDECAEEFSRGDSAMVILYNSDAGNINNYSKSKVAGNLGYSLIPGGTPVLGGWSLGLNRYGEHQEEAEQFLLWACDKQNSIPLSMLGGSTLRSNYYERTDSDMVEPWKLLSMESNKQSRLRAMPEILDDSRWTNKIYTTILPGEIMRYVNNEISEEQALLNIEKKIKLLLE